MKPLLSALLIFLMLGTSFGQNCGGFSLEAKIKKSCPEYANGSITITVKNGYGDFDVYWNNGITFLDRYQLQAGNYSVVVKDERGCSVTKSFMIESFVEIEAKIQLKREDNITTLELEIEEDSDIQYIAWVNQSGFLNEHKTKLKDAKLGLYNVFLIDRHKCSTILSTEVLE